MTEVSKIPEKSGIYRIHSSLEFPRLNGETDILYIGKAKNLHRRLMTFIKGHGRSAIGRFNKLRNSGFDLLFSFELSDEPRQREEAELTAYETKHWELPPLNRHN